VRVSRGRSNSFVEKKKFGKTWGKNQAENGRELEKSCYRRTVGGRGNGAAGEPGRGSTEEGKGFFAMT